MLGRISNVLARHLPLWFKGSMRELILGNSLPSEGRGDPLVGQTSLLKQVHGSNGLDLNDSLLSGLEERTLRASQISLPLREL